MSPKPRRVRSREAKDEGEIERVPARLGVTRDTPRTDQILKRHPARSQKPRLDGRDGGSNKIKVFSLSVGYDPVLGSRPGL
ncbi:hypothetical protein THAOC_29720, partial [Thalassiosira oceanica]